MFSMKNNERIQFMIVRLQTILNSLRSLRVTINHYEINHKVLRTLPPLWRAQEEIALRASKDLETMYMEELEGIILINEQVLQGDVKNIKVKDLTLKSSQKEKKVTSIKVDKVVNDASDSSHR